MRYLGIDYGNRKVGLAISDEAGIFAFPYQVLPNDSLAKLSAEIKNICLKEGVGGIILGESLNLSGQANLIQAEILKFKENLEKELDLPIKFQKEFFTTQEARRMIDEAGTDTETDARAAALILKSFIDNQRVS